MDREFKDYNPRMTGRPVAQHYPSKIPSGNYSSPEIMEDMSSGEAYPRKVTFA